MTIVSPPANPALLGHDGPSPSAAPVGRPTPLNGSPPAPTLARRLAWVRAFRGLIATHLDDLVRLIADELGRPPWEALTADVLTLLSACKWHERHAPRALAPRRVRDASLLGLGQRVTITHEPLGTVAIIATWNYPVQLLGIQLLQAITAGNRVIVKPSELAPRSQALLLDLAERAAHAAGLPTDTLARRHATRDAGRALLDEPGLDHVVFTGSTAVGRDIARALADRLIPSTLELSGRDSAFVLADCSPRLLKLAAQSIFYAVTVNSGQTCMAPKRVLVDRRVYTPFCQRLGGLFAGAKPKPIISERAARDAFDQARDAVHAGGRSLSGITEPPTPDAHGRWWLRPLAIADCPPGLPLERGLNFAPVLAVLPVDSPDHALAIHHGHHAAAPAQHLATSVFTATPHHAARHLAPRLAALRVTINDCVMPVGHPATHIGGVGPSGWGTSRGRLGLLALTRPLCTSITSTRLRTPLDTPPLTHQQRATRFLASFYRATPNSSPASAKREHP